METFWALSLLLIATTLGVCTGDTQDRVYRVTSIVNEPYLVLRNANGTRGNDMYEGFIVDLLAAVADYANFRYEIELVPDNRFGRREGQGRWNGMIGQLVRGEADIAAAPLTQTANRRTVVDFAYPFQPVTLTALMREDVDIDSIEELANQTAVNYGTFHEGATQQAFIGATQAVHSRMWAHMASQKRSPFVRDFKEGLKRVRNEDFAFIVERPMGEYIVGRPPCDLKLIGRFTTDALPRSFSFALPKQHPLLNDINAAMLHLQEDMTIAKMHRKWWPDHCMITGGATTTSAVTSLALMLGLCIALGVL